MTTTANRRLRGGLKFSALVAVTIALVTSSCATQESSNPDLILDLLAERGQATDAVYVDRSLAQALPNQTYSDLDTGQTYSISDAVVLGTVIEARVAAAYSFAGDGIDYREVPAEDPEADWRMVSVTIAPERTWGEAPVSEPVVFQLPLNGAIPVKTGVASVGELGRVVVVLEGDRVVRNEQLLGTVDDEGRIAFVGATAMPDYADGLDTVAELASALEQRPAPVYTRGWHQVPEPIALPLLTSDTPEGLKDRRGFASCGYRVVSDPDSDAVDHIFECLRTELEGAAGSAPWGAEAAIALQMPGQALEIEYYRVGPELDGVETFRLAAPSPGERGEWLHRIHSVAEFDWHFG